MRISALTVLPFAAALCAGCAITIDGNDDWLPLAGTALSPPPMVTTDDYSPVMYLPAPDGRLWVGDHLSSPAFPAVRSLEADSVERDFPSGSSWTDDGVLSVSALDDPSAPSGRFHLELDSLAPSIPTVAHDIELGAAASAPPVVRRGVGYMVYEDAASIHILYDDGREDSFPSGPEHWSFTQLSSSALPRGSLAYGGVTGDAHHLLLQGADDQVAVYDLQARALRPLFTLPGNLQLPTGPGEPDGLDPPLPWQYDATHERIWVCGDPSFTVLVTTGERRDFGFACIDLRYRAGQEVLMQADDGTVYALGSDGATEDSLGQLPPHAIRAWSGRTLIHTRPGFDDLAGGAFGGWLGDERVIGSGGHARFSADGKRLRWLEQAAESGVGDLVSFDLATHQTRHLVRNVRQFAELPDGRLVAVANAVSEGPWNRVIVVDEDKGETSWLAKGYSRLVVRGDDVIAARQRARWESVLLAVPR